MASVDFVVDEFIFNEAALRDVIEEGSKMLIEDVKKNAQTMLKANNGYMNSGKYTGDPALLTRNMGLKINVAKGEGKITFKGTQKTGWAKKPKPKRNNEIAFINEYGAPGRSMNARPFMLKSCVELRSDEIKALEKLIQ